VITDIDTQAATSVVTELRRGATIWQDSPPVAPPGVTAGGLDGALAELAAAESSLAATSATAVGRLADEIDALAARARQADGA
jgi:hypothetical protein